MGPVAVVLKATPQWRPVLKDGRTSGDRRGGDRRNDGRNGGPS
ncbi:MAG: hypothetical protein QOE45_1422 [Frankiaceae bacterium]|nr:hypothetical protein [Frankiaceae bacterium]